MRVLTVFSFFLEDDFDLVFDLVAPESVQSGSKDSKDGEEVGGEFFGRREVSSIENHDLPIGAPGEDGVEQVKTETAEPILMCDDNLSDISFDCVVQKGLKSFSLEVDA